MSATHGGPVSKRQLAGLSLAALGVVYGDIGTSPLYALKECFGAAHGIPPTSENILGVLSLILWSMNFVVSYKYITHVMRADNRGEGGILALLALVSGSEGRRRMWLVLLGLFGAALLYGDGIITPAISVLGAIDGLEYATPVFKPWVVPITVVILLLLFLVQKRGTAGLGGVFGPVMILWFGCIAVLGVTGILREPGVLKAINPWYAVDFFIRDGLQGFLILGAVVLVLTGGEALYADMGHFGRTPIRIAWFGVALPALTLNYFGQGALLLQDPGAVRSPFYALVPGPFLYPMVAIATAAAIVASQALISGAFSLTQQAVQLGYWPRVTITHTSEKERGQIYVPDVNWALMVACIWLVISFRSSSNLAAAYGIAVTGTMGITTILFSVVARERWGWSRLKVGVTCGLFLAVDVAFFLANMVKFVEGGWFPIVVALGIFTLMSTWKRGRIRLSRIMEENSLPIDLFLHDVPKRCPTRVSGTAVFMTSHPGGAPPVLLHHVKHNKVLHEQVILMSIITEDVPYVPEEDRVSFRDLGQKFYAVTGRYGFMDTPDVPSVLRRLQAYGVGIRPMETTYYLGRETLIATPGPRHSPPAADGQPSPPYLSMWRKRLFILMTRNAQSATTFFNLPPNRVVEMGAQIQF
ncbi:MAG: potassium transporter Kup [Gemmatimonadota bacterium]|mgnify:CR=1 FL=1|nr:potassium transporter Kup [Gemmatimonadota bacterium]